MSFSPRSSLLGDRLSQMVSFVLTSKFLVETLNECGVSIPSSSNSRSILRLGAKKRLLSSFKHLSISYFNTTTKGVSLERREVSWHTENDPEIEFLKRTKKAVDASLSGGEIRLAKRTSQTCSPRFIPLQANAPHFSLAYCDYPMMIHQLLVV